jgi:secretory phospholipase A2
LTFTFSNDNEGKVLLRKLARINRPLKIDFGDMLKLMQQCSQVDKNREISKRKAQGFAALYERNSELRADDRDSEMQNDAPVPDEDENNRGLLSGNPFSLFSGVFPGTKWCGTGDIARNFHDLGTVSLK